MAIAQLVQISGSLITWTQEKINGPAPLNLPLRQIHSGMMEEIEFNLDCLKSYDRLLSGGTELDPCTPKSIYIDSWFSNVAAHTSRDYYSSSEATLADWKKLRKFYKNIDGIRNHEQFVEFETNSDLTLRDTLFLTGYIRYFYNNYFEEPMPEGCGPRTEVVICIKNERRLFGKFPAWKKQIDTWALMPAKYTIDDGKPVEWYADWLALAD